MRASLILLRGLLALSAVVAALLLAEVALRFLPAPAPAAVEEEPTDALWADNEWRGPPPRVFRPDPVLAFTYEPNAEADVRVAEHQNGAFRFRTNGYGLRRDHDVALPRPDGTFRVLVVGDSQTSGYGTNAETYPGRLEALLQERAGGRTVEVLNGGVDGYSPQQAYLWLRAYGQPLTPDLVIFALYAGNDISDLARHRIDPVRLDDAAGLVSPFRTPGQWLNLHSVLAQRVGPVAEPAVTAALTSLGVAEPEAPLASQADLVRLLRECHRCWFQSVKQAVRARQQPDDIAMAYRRLGTLFGLLKEYAAEHDTRVLVLVIPTKTQVEPEDERGARGRAARLLTLSADDLAYDTVAYTQILAAAAAADMAAIDPLEDMRDAARQRRLYYRRDWHLNPAGNEALAAALERDLASGAWLP